MKEKTPEEMDRIYQYITDRCLQYFDSPTEEISPYRLALSIMKGNPEFFIHGPEHHYLIPAVLLTACRKADGDSRQALESDLAKAAERSRNVLKAFCGLYGACGAAVSLGVFSSILTGTTPLSIDTWGIVNTATADSLKRMADIGGPRCCKGNTFVALEYAVPFIDEHFHLHLDAPEEIVCDFYQQNQECRRSRCPYYPREKREADQSSRTSAPLIPIIVPKGTIPLRDPAKKNCRCSCRKDQGIVIWKKDVGSSVDKGEPICEIEADKSVTEVVAPAEGVLCSFRLQDGDLVGNEELLGYIEVS